MRRELVWTHDFLGRQTGVVSRGLLSLTTDRTLDGAETLSLSVPADDPKVPLLVEGTELRLRDTRWVVDEIIEDRSGSQAVVKVEAIASWSRLAELTIVGQLTLSDRTVRSGARTILAGTTWSVGMLTADVGDHQMQDNDMTVLAAARRWATITGTMVVFDTAAKTVDWVPVRGIEVGLAFRYGRNISSLRRRHRAPTITELWPFGASELTIAGVNGGRPYLEDYTWWTDRGVSLSAARSRHKRRVVWSDPAITSELDLLAAGQAVLDASSGGSETIELSVVDISSITGVAEELQPGDRVRALDSLVGAEFQATVTRVQRDWLAPAKGSIELSTSPQTVASPASSSRTSSALQWLQFTGRVGGEYRVRNDGIWTLARVSLRFGEAGQGHMTASVQLVGAGAGVARLWIYDATDDVVVREAFASFADGERVPVTLSAGIPAAAGRHDYRLRVTTDATGGADPDVGVDVAADPAGVAAFWVMAWGAVQETPVPETSVTFDYTGAVQHWTVPDGVTQARFQVSGAAGGTSSSGLQGGAGGVVSGVVPVVPGQSLDIYVGGMGAGPGFPAGGWPNGGAGGSVASADVGAGGGGSSFVCLPGGTIATARIAAGGAGGASSWSPTTGGAGGLFVAGDAVGVDPDTCGKGATQFSGGPAAVSGAGSPTAGTAGVGGAGSGSGSLFANMGGGGGGGRFGGGGGDGSGVNAGDPAGGGGGGTGWIDPDVFDIQVTDGGNTGHGQITISWEE